ncbi:hypothetical protein M9458_053856 [Cirrhinus mrigala]|uniref:Gypsy retrotransposon integrase-like protein 1 n=1 Tax=Cirrhinus mrigala TaxID=683832 RepID=A0ABD0MPZ7_CIRMR
MSDQLFRLQQSTSSVHDYTLHFRTLAAASGWNEVALLGAYRQGLNPEIRAAMALYDDAIGLETFLPRTTRVSQRLAACQPPYQNQCKWTLITYHAQKEIVRSRWDCLYCGQPGHHIRNCPVRPPRPVVSTIQSDVETAHLTLLPVVLLTADRLLHVSALIDSGSAGNVITQECLDQLQLSRQRHPHEYAIKTIQGKPIGCGRIRHSSPYITFHSERIRNITGWTERCYEQCLTNVPRPPVPVLLSSTQVESPEPENPPEIPAEYMASQDVFSKQAATHLPPHRPWDCAIELLPGVKLPKGKVYPLSIPERQAMEEYIEEALRQGFIQPSTSPAASSFFVGKKDEGLRPCIDYRQLNSQIVQQPYPLLLVPAALVELCGAWVFTKLDLRSAYNLVRIREGDEWKTVFITPTGVSGDAVRFIHQSLRLPNIYERSVPGVPASCRGCANGPGESRKKALQQLKSIFSTAPILHHPDPELSFTVEVDASTIGVGTVLSRAVGESSLLHPCAFSCNLTPAEQNYDVGIQELLAIKLALEEWRHWLEGATHPFTIITDHKNLQYHREARRLNPRQARWALFLTCFQFTITYRPGSKNIPANALSRLYSPETTSEPEPIIPSELIVSPIIWELDQEIQQATLQEPAPPECPEGKAYVPRSQWLTLLGTAHGSLGSGHPGSSRTLSLLQYHYWWPSMHRDTISLTHPVNFLQANWFLYPIPQRPWSHIGVDFITDLPVSEGNTCVLVIVDHFSKSCKLVPLRGLPTAMETAEQLFHQAFRHFGLPEEIVSDRGPQFTSHVWKAFFKLLGVSVNLSSGYHPQTNGQTERKIQELGCYFRAYCQDDQHSWSRFLPWGCVLGYQPPLFPWTEEPSNVPAVDHWFREGERVSDSAHYHLQRAVRRHKSFADARRRAAPNYQPGDLVWLSTRDLRLRLPCHKLSPRYIAPFRFLRLINVVTFQLQLLPRYRIHPTFHVSLLKPSSPSATEPPGAEAEPPSPEVLDQPSVFTVHEILDSQLRGGRLEYLVDWEGYGPEERSWVNRDDVLDPLLLLEFHRSHPNRPAPRSHGHPRSCVRASGAAPGGGDEISVQIGEELNGDVLLPNADKVQHQSRSSTEWMKVWRGSSGVQSERMTISDGNLIISNFTARDGGSYRVLDPSGKALITVKVRGYWSLAVALIVFLVLLVPILTAVTLHKRLHRGYPQRVNSGDKRGLNTGEPKALRAHTDV